MLIQLIGITLSGLILSACINNGSDSVNGSHQYWDGGELEGQPIYSLTHGVSQAAHNAFKACGLANNAIETSVTTYLDGGSERQVLVAGDVESESEPLWKVVVTVEPLTPDMYLVTCSREETYDPPPTQWFFRKVRAHDGFTTRARSRSKLARPYI